MTTRPSGIGRAARPGLDRPGNWTAFLRRLRRNILISRGVLRYHAHGPGGLPVMITISGRDINYQSTIPESRFPTTDEKSRLFGFEGGPVVGVLGGAWDTYRHEWFSRDVVVRSLRARFLEGRPWEETEMGRGRVAGRGRYRLDARLAEIDELYRSLKTNGYLRPVAAPEPPCTIHGLPYPDDCRVGIGRDGEIIRFRAGRHRITLAKILDLDSVPVIVVVRHRLWQAVRDAFARAGSLEALPEKYWRFVGHPDLADVSRIGVAGSRLGWDPARPRQRVLPRYPATPSIWRAYSRR